MLAEKLCYSKPTKSEKPQMPVASSKAKRLVNNFRIAVGDWAFKGSAHPGTWEDIEMRYQKARGNLLLYIADLEQAQVTFAKFVKNPLPKEKTRVILDDRD